jgi:hypothetical protein
MIGFKCFKCFYIVPIEEVKVEGTCPVCGEVQLFKRMCERDTGACTCAEDAKPSIILCPVCDEPVCPNDFSHDVVSVSRVTGYLSSVEGWRKSKKAELRDRHRVDIN